MKTIILSALFLFSLSTHGQKLSLGLKAGGDLTTLNRSVTQTSSQFSVTPFNFNYIPDFQIGIFGKKQFSYKTGIVFEPGFIQKGSGNSDFKVHLGYLNLPVLFYYNFLNNLNLEIGQELGYKLYEKSSPAAISNFIQYHFDYGLILGLSYSIDKNFNLGARYSYSLTRSPDSFIFTDNNNSYIGKIDMNYNSSYFEVFVRYALLNYN